MVDALDSKSSSFTGVSVGSRTRGTTHSPSQIGAARLLIYWALFAFFLPSAALVTSGAGARRSLVPLAIGAIIIALLVGLRYAVGADRPNYEFIFSSRRSGRPSPSARIRRCRVSDPELDRAALSMANLGREHRLRRNLRLGGSTALRSPGRPVARGRRGHPVHGDRCRHGLHRARQSRSESLDGRARAFQRGVWIWASPSYAVFACYCSTRPRSSRLRSSPCPAMQLD